MSLQARYLSLNIVDSKIANFSVPTTFATYINDYLKPQNLDKLGNGMFYCSMKYWIFVNHCFSETLYLFGDIDQTVWKPLLNQYLQPPWKVPGHTAALSFGIAGKKSALASLWTFWIFTLFQWGSFSQRFNTCITRLILFSVVTLNRQMLWLEN